MLLTSLLLIGVSCSLEQDSIHIGAGGDLHQQSPLVRRDEPQAEEEERENARRHHHKHQHHHGNQAKALFQAMDLNEDGVVSVAEVKISAQRTGASTPTDLLKTLSAIDTNADGGISYAEFEKAANAATHLVGIREHREASELEKTHEDPDGETAAVRVTCGGHTAGSCGECPTTDENGHTVMDHGEEWCNGDCEYKSNVCVAIGTVTVDGTVQAAEAPSTPKVPDLLDPDISKKDEEIIDDAAQAAVKEETLEKATKEEEEKEATEGDFDWGKFWLIVIITFAVILGLCALVSVVALFVFCFMPKPDLPPTKEELLADAADEGEDAGEEVYGEDES